MLLFPFGSSWPHPALLFADLRNIYLIRVVSPLSINVELILMITLWQVYYSIEVLFTITNNSDAVRQ